jgi:aryl-alcohol dehydrogenase-like predicted oxidoreductase
MNRLALGTVQFGQNYGIANSTGQMSRSEVEKILELARLKGINTLDTAIAYGESENVLGKIGVQDFNIISKLPELPTACSNIKKWMESQLNDSLKRLRLDSIYGFLLHRPQQLLEPGNKNLWSTLLDFKTQGLVKKIGFSIYGPNELDQLWPQFKPDIIQAPYNIFDRRMVTSGWFKRLSDEGVETHARSVFLQGLLLLNKYNRPQQFDKWSDHWHLWDRWLKENKLTPLQAALTFPLVNNKVNKVIVGVDHCVQLKEILEGVDTSVNDFSEELSITDEQLINPSNWIS